VAAVDGGVVVAVSEWYKLQQRNNPPPQLSNNNNDPTTIAQLLHNYHCRVSRKAKECSINNIIIIGGSGM